ncbi:MAG: hypothetical protein V3S24_04735 [Candidatus Tectomicrobia bacterium]
MACDGAPEIRRLLAILPGKPAPYAGKIPDKRPAKDRYVRFDRATWVELQGFLQDRTAHAKWARGEVKERAQRWREDLRVKMEALAPYMAQNPTMTVVGACRLIHRNRVPASRH